MVLYTTSLHRVRKTFDNYARMRQVLEGLHITFLECGVSMYAPY